MKKLIYFHGFGSSGEGGTVKTLRELLPDWIVLAPDIPVDPKDALPFLKDLCQTEQPDIVVGTSMGGMYAQQMRGFKRICVNPAFYMSKQSKALKEGIFEFSILGKTVKRHSPSHVKPSNTLQKWKLISLMVPQKKIRRLSLGFSVMKTLPSIAREFFYSITRMLSIFMVNTG